MFLCAACSAHAKVLHCAVADTRLLLFALCCVCVLYYYCSGDLQVLSALRSKGIKWDVQTPAFAAAAGHLHVVQVAISCFPLTLRYHTVLTDVYSQCKLTYTSCCSHAILLLLLDSMHASAYHCLLL
jgi:hypothetical protein